MASKLDYLKKYMTSEDNDGDKKKKKKKKSKVKDAGGLKIIDENSFVSKAVDDSGRSKKKTKIKEEHDSDNEEALALMTTQEELPQVAGIVDDSRLKTRFTTGNWQDAFKVKEEPLSDDDEAPQHPKPQRTNDLSPLRRQRLDSPDNSPPRRKRINSGSPDNSPPRRKRLNSGNPDASPPRRKRHDSDVSPPRRQRHDSDASPPRRKAQDSPDISPPTRRKSRFSNVTPDNSPPRRKRLGSADSDISPPRQGAKIKEEPDSDISPPRRKEYDSDNSPPRKVKEEPSDDLSPPRSSKLMTKTLDGKKAGLQNARALKEELDELKTQERKYFETLSAEQSGRFAETKVRGRLREKAEEEQAKKEKAEAVRKEMEAKYAKWNKGVKQLEEAKSRLASDLHEMDKPLARSKNDEDLDAHLKAVEREEDPMLQYMRSKQKKAAAAQGLPQYPKYKGPPPPPNRFGIAPGYRWDGVDRSTGFEKRLFESQSKRKAIVEEAHMWSTEDM